MIIRKATRLTEEQTKEVMSTLIEVTLPKGRNTDEVFGEIVAILRCIGLSTAKRDILSQTCHILKKRNRFFICHYKQLMQLDGRPTEFTLTDQRRVFRIVEFLAANNLCKPKHKLPVYDKSDLNIFYFGVHELPDNNVLSEQPDRVILKANYTFGDTPQMISATTRQPATHERYAPKKTYSVKHSTGKKTNKGTAELKQKPVTVIKKKPLVKSTPTVNVKLDTGETVRTQVVKRRS